MSKSKDNAIAYVVRRDDGVFWDARNDKWDEEWDAPLEDTVFDETVVPERIVRENGGRVVALGELPEPVLVDEEEQKMLKIAKEDTYPSAVISNYMISMRRRHPGSTMTGLELRLMRALINGYKVVRPKRYYVKVAGKFKRETFYALKGGILAFGRFDKAMIQDYDPHAFTMQEIEENGLQDCEREEVPENEN